MDNLAFDILEFLFLKIMPWILLALIFLGLPFLIYSYVHESNKPEFCLKKDEWRCAKVHEYQSTTYILVGKVMVPQTTTHRDCVDWISK